MLRKILLLTTVGLLILPLTVFSQQGTVIKGKVSDEEGNPLPGANVIIEGTTYGAASDASGNYEFRVPADFARGQEVQLVAKFIGYKTATATIRLTPGEIVQDFKMEVDVIGLEEIVVVGYGTARKEELTGSIKVVRSEKMEQLPTSSFQDVLQGTPGMQVVANDGAPGAGISVRVRGIGSISASNEPLYVIDGIPVISGSVSFTDFGNGGRSSNVLAAINPNDIESIVIAKDAASTAIYGSRGANGVVFITTKGGVAGSSIQWAQGPKLEAKFQRGYSSFAFPNLLQGLNAQQYKELFIEGYVNSGRLTAAEAEERFQKLYPEADRTNTIWLDEITHTGITDQLDLSAQGGGDRFTYYVSSSYFNQQGVIINNFFRRYSSRINLTANLTNRIKIANNLNLSYFKQRGITDGTRWQSPMYNAYLLAPVIPVFDEQGQYYAKHKSFFMGGNNPVGHLNEDKRELEQTRIIDNFLFTYNIARGLNFQATFSFDILNVDEYLYVNPRYGDGRNVGGAANESRTDIINWQINQTLNYNRTFGRAHNVDLLLGFEQQKLNTDNVEDAGEGFPHPSLKTLASAANPTLAVSLRSESAFQSIFSRANYNYKNKYFVSASFRRDGSSRFGPERRWGNFWSFGLGYTLTEEKWFTDRVKFFDYLKLRASYGETGNAEIGNFPWAGLYGFNREYDGQPGAAPSQIGNPFLTWEKQQNFNIGVDFAFWDNRITGTIERYIRDSKDLLLDRPLSLTTGFREVTQNVGDMRNSGWEFSFDAELLRKKDTRLAVNFNITTLNNVITRLPEPLQVGNFRREEGRDFYEYWLFGWAGVDPENGDPLWYTDSTKTKTTNKIGEAERFYDGKSAIPDFFGSFGFTARYRRFTLDAQFNYQFGNYLYYNPGWVIHGDGRFTPRSTSRFAFENRWRKPGDKALFPKFMWGGNKSSNVRNSSRYLYKGDFIRLKSLRVAYRFPDIYAFRVGAKSLEAYIYLYNFFTWVADQYLHFDPEQAPDGIYNTVTPISKTFTFGINVGL